MKDLKESKNANLKLISLSPKKQKYIQKCLNMEQNIASSDHQKKQLKLEIINSNQNKTNQIVRKESQQNIKKKDIKLETRRQFNLTKFLKREIQKQREISILDIQKQIEQENRNSPNVINMQFIFSVYKNNYKKLQDLKKKLAMYQYQREMSPRQNIEFRSEEEYLEALKHTDRMLQKQQTKEDQSQIDGKTLKDIIKCPVIYDFRDLEKHRLNKMKQTIKMQQKIKHNANFHLSPLRKCDLTEKINSREILTGEKLKSVQKKTKHQNVKTATIKNNYKTLEQKILFQTSNNFHPNKQKSLEKDEKTKLEKIQKPKKFSFGNEYDSKTQATNKDNKFVFISERARMRQTVYKNSEHKQVLTNFMRPKSHQRKKLQQIKQFSLTKRNFYKKDHFVFGLSHRPIAENKVEYYRDFLWKINMSNNLFIQPEVELEKNFKIYIGKGNNSMLIKGLIKRRFWWTVVEKINEQVNFIWTQLKVNDFFDKQKNCIKQVTKTEQTQQTQSEISLNSTTIETNSQNENKKLKNSKEQEKGKDASNSKDYHEYIFSQNDLGLWNGYMQKNRKYEQELNPQIYTRRAILLKTKNAKKIYNPSKLKIQNHFNANFFIGNKKALFYSMRKYYDLNNLNVFDYLPLTFHISKGLEDPQFQKFLKYYNKIQENKNQSRLKNIWIVKPGEFTNRGTGITVCATLQDVKVRIRGRQKNSNGKYRTFIVQKYLERPFLYHKRKFDIRHYMMMTCINGSFKGYWYQQGYIRTTSYEYNMKNCKDNSIHLTNDAIQKYTQQYGKYQKGNKLSYQQFQKYLDHHHKHSNFDFFQTILPKMKKICTDAIRASYFLLDPDRKAHNFQIFGMDFMIDQEFNPWLIQINTNPCLQLSSPLLAKIIPNMVQNSFKIGLDPLFQPPYNWPLTKKYQLGDNPLQSNKFQIIFDENVEGQQIQELYKNVERVDKNMGQIQQQDEQYEDEGKEWNEQI